jgi:hypothetical protein
MKLMHFAALAGLCGLAMVIMQSSVSAKAPVNHEDPAILVAADLLPADWLVGPSHRVRDTVVTDGFLAHFEIDTDFGTFKAVGVPQARQRIAETAAIRTLVQTSRSDLFAEGLKRSVKQPVDAVKNIATHPVESMKQAPVTVGHFFSKVGSSIERGVQKTMGSSGSPDASDIGDAAKNAAGFDKAKLDTAKQLGVDPYSDNARLQQEMDKVTWAFFAGGLPLRIGAAVASAGVALAATNMIGVPDETYALTRTELALRDSRSLSAMGIRETDITGFQVQPQLGTTRRHQIVKSLEALSGAAGRGRIILLANSCENTRQADFLVAAVSMLAARQLSGAADYRELHVFGRLAGASTAAATLEVPAPVDYVSWTQEVAEFARRDDLGTLPKLLVHTGRLTENATQGFTEAGWRTIALPYPAR